MRLMRMYGFMTVDRVTLHVALHVACIAPRLCRSFSAFRRFVGGSSSRKGLCPVLVVPSPGEWITH